MLVVDCVVVAIDDGVDVVFIRFVARDNMPERIPQALLFPMEKSVLGVSMGLIMISPPYSGGFEEKAGASESRFRLLQFGNVERLDLKAARFEDGLGFGK